MKQIDDLYNQYKTDIFSYLMWLTHNPTLSEDLLQETFVKAITSLGNYKGESTLKTWLFSIARHCWLQNIRKTKPQVEYSDQIDVPIIDDCLNNLISKKIVERLFELLSQKDEKTQVILKLRYEGYSFYEISQKLGIHESSARVVDFRTKRWLRSILIKEGLI